MPKTMTFAEYYDSKFRHDLSRIVAAMPPMHDHGDGEITIQPRLLSLGNPVIRSWPDERRWLFAAALFLTVLVDEVCYTHFQPAYPRFKELTQYPKLRGDCPGGCGWHAHPELIWRSIATPEGRPYRQDTDIPYELIPGDFLGSMEEEIRSFLAEHLPEIDGGAFWERCAREIAPVFRLLWLGAHLGAKDGEVV